MIVIERLELSARTSSKNAYANDLFWFDLLVAGKTKVRLEWEFSF